MRQFSFILFILSILTINLNAQTVENFKLTKNYSGTLDKILPEVGLDLNVRFIFDKDYLKKYQTVLMTDQEKTVGGMLKMFRASCDMITLVSNDGFIYIAKDKEQLDQLQHHKEIVATEITQNRKKRVPVKRIFCYPVNCMILKMRNEYPLLQ